MVWQPESGGVFDVSHYCIGLLMGRPAKPNNVAEVWVRATNRRERLAAHFDFAWTRAS